MLNSSTAARRRPRRRALAACAGLALLPVLAPSAHATSSQPYADAVLADSPISYLRLEDDPSTGTAADATGAHAGTFFGTGTTSVQGAMGDSLGIAFDATQSGGIRWPIPALVTNTSGQFTIEAWVKQDDWISSAPFLYTGSGTTAVVELFTTNLLGLAPTNSLGSQPIPGAFTGNAWGLTNNINGSLSLGDSLLAPHNWNYLVLTRDANSTWREYLNGQLAPRTSSSQLRQTAGAVLGSGHTNSREFGGALDEVAVYTRALTATQIQTHYQAAVDVGINGPAAPVSLTDPSIVSAAAPDFQVEQVLEADEGTWNTPDVGYHYQWSRCDASGSSCVAIPGETTKYYRPSASDEGSTFTVDVTATDTSGSATVTTAATPVLTGLPAPNYRAAVLASTPETYNPLDDVVGQVTFAGGIRSQVFGGGDITGHLHSYGLPTTLGVGAIGVPGAMGGSRGVTWPDTGNGTGQFVGTVLNTTTNWSVEEWVDPDTTADSTLASAGVNFRLLLHATTTCPGELTVQTGSNTAGTGSFGTGSCVPTGSWSYVVITRDASTTRLYVNGVEAAREMTGAASVLTPSGALSAGVHGSFDEVAVYRHALSQTEVTDHYDAAVTDGLD